MQISIQEWTRYRNALSKVNKKAAEEFAKFCSKKQVELGVRISQLDRYEVIQAAYSIATKYGEASGALAAEFYDEMAAASGANVPAAVPAETASYSQTKKTMNNALETSDNTDYVASFVEKLTKQVGQDTIVRNAARDRAEFAWIPSGDACAFCLTLASKGWQRTSKEASRFGHADHIHQNCECAYSVRFSKEDNVSGYNPDKYRKMYDDADGYTNKQKIRAMRRDWYDENADEINAKKREAYALRKSLEDSTE